ncbi:MAG TPA: hypothetical protein EYP10_08575, partial [Armatimonadetes bacterium]|nr:hypothetical protein [Armatimonadota bacterium]
MECNIAREQVESIHKEGWDATMKLFTFVELMLMAFIMISSAVVHAGIEPIKTVEIGKNREIRVNGKPFLPIMAWLQDPKNFETVKQCGMNVIAGYWSGSGGTKDVSEYLELVAKAGLYGVMPFDPKLKGHPMLLGYIHPDEPDLLRKISDARVEHAPYMRINRRTPLWKLVDGDVFSWSVFDPLEGAWVTIHLKKPATIHSIAVWLTVSSGLSLAKEVAFKADGREILRVTLEPRRGRQQFKLKRPVTLQRLTMKVLKVTRGKNIYGSFGEIEAFDANGRNVLLVRPKSVPRLTPEEVMERYRDIKRQDATRPVFMTLTGCFHPHFKKWGE